MTPSVEALINQHCEITGINEKTLPPVGTVFVLSKTGAATLNKSIRRSGPAKIYFPGQEFMYVILPKPNPPCLEGKNGKTYLLFTHTSPKHTSIWLDTEADLWSKAKLPDRQT